MSTATIPAIIPDPDVTAKRRGLRRGAAATDSPPRSGQKRAGWLVRGVITIICLLWLIPTLGTILTSFRTVDDAQATGWWHLFADPGSLTRLTLQNYSEAFNGSADLGQAFASSFAITLPATIIPIMFAAFGAYAFTFMTFKGREFLFVLIVSMLVVPNQVAFLPLLKIYTSLGIQGTFAAVWLAHSGFAMSLAMYILRNFMSTLPREVIESAKIDGATHFQMFWKLVVPMSVPALAAFAIFQFLWVWNDLLVALVFIGSGPNQPLPLAIKSLLGQQGQGWQLLTAGGIIMMLVPVAVFLALQRFFVRGLTSGAVKG